MASMNNAHALIVGIANYRNVNPLPNTVLEDARDVHKVLVDPALCGYPADPTRVKLIPEDEATRENLLTELDRLAKRADADSVVFLYFSCHGGRLEDGEHAGEYLLPIEADLSSAESLAATALSGAEVADALDSIAARKSIFVFDCCHSSGIGLHKAANAPSFKAAAPDHHLEKLGLGRGWVVMTSSRESELSYILPHAKNSLFTEQLLAGLKGGAASDDEYVRIFSLFEYLQPRVTGARRDQHPVFKAKIEDNFPVALRLGGQKGAIPKVEPGFRYDAYISYVDSEPDSTYVWETLLPRLEAAGLKVAVSNDSEAPGVARIVGIERAIRESKRTVIVLSDAYLNDHMADFQSVLGQTMGIEEGSYRLLPIKIATLGETIPTRLSQLVTLDLTHPKRASREFDRLVNALRGPLPTR
jgi:Caspase domain/TIR domain